MRRARHARKVKQSAKGRNHANPKVWSEISGAACMIGVGVAGRRGGRNRDCPLMGESHLAQDRAVIGRKSLVNRGVHHDDRAIVLLMKKASNLKASKWSRKTSCPKDAPARHGTAVSSSSTLPHTHAPWKKRKGPELARPAAPPLTLATSAQLKLAVDGSGQVGGTLYLPRMRAEMVRSLGGSRSDTVSCDDRASSCCPILRWRAL